MKELLWATVALLLLVLLTLIAIGLRAVPGNKRALGVANVFEDGLLFAVFAILFAPFYLAGTGLQSIWKRFHPSAALPVAGDDPVWGRRINRQVVETAFLAVQQARMKQNANLAKRFISQELYQRLRHECEQTTGVNQTGSHKDILIKDIVLSDERVADHLCYFNATVSGSISTAAQDRDHHDEAVEHFEEQLEFARALPEVKDARWQLMRMSR